MTIEREDHPVDLQPDEDLRALLHLSGKAPHDFVETGSIGPQTFYNCRVCGEPGFAIPLEFLNDDDQDRSRAAA